MPLCILIGAAIWVVASASQGPLSVVDARPKTHRQISAAPLSAAVALVGSKQPSPETRQVQYEDKASLGPASSGEGWLLRTNVVVHGREEVVDLPLNGIVDNTTQRLMVAYTDPLGEWPTPPTDNTVGLDRVSKEAGWVMDDEVPSKMASNAAEVIGAVWREIGFDPTKTGQIIVRPRWISPQLPAKMVNGRLVPVSAKHKAWIVQICGTKMREDRNSYFTQRFIHVKDSSLEFVWSFYLP